MKLNIYVASLLMITGGYVQAGVLQESGTPYTPKPVSVAYSYKIDKTLATKQQVIKIMPSTWKLRLAKNVSFEPTGPVLKEDTWVSYLKRVTLENNIKTQLDWNTRVATITLNDGEAEATNKSASPNLINYAFVEEGNVVDVKVDSVHEPSLTIREILMTKLPLNWKVKVDKSFDVSKTIYVGKEITLSNLFRQIANELSAHVTMNYRDNVIIIRKYEYAVNNTVNKPLPNDTDVNVKNRVPTAATSNTPVITKPYSKAVIDSQLQMLESLKQYLSDDEHIIEFENILALPLEKQIFVDNQKLALLNIYSMLRFSDEKKIPNVQNNAFTLKLLELRSFVQSKRQLFNPSAQPFKPQAYAESMKNADKVNSIVENKRVDEIQPIKPMTKVFALELEDKSVLNAMERWAKENGWGFNKEKEMLDFVIEDRKVFNKQDIKSAITEVINALNFYSKDTKVNYYVNFSNDGTNKTIMVSDRPFELQ